MTIMIVMIKIITNLTHYSRSLALSAPKNLGSAFIKYLLIPGLGNYYLERDRYTQMMSRTDELKDREIEDRYRLLIKEKDKEAKGKKA